MIKNILLTILIVLNIILLGRSFGVFPNTSTFEPTTEFGVGGAPPTPIYDDTSNVVSIVKQAKPAVVTIALSADLPSREGTESFEGNVGSGFILREDGYVVTNKHVMSLPIEDYTVVLHNGQKYRVEVIHEDPENDLAILQINAQGLPELTLADSTEIQLGESVIVIGTTFGEFTNSVTTGIVSGLERDLNADSDEEMDELTNLIQTDAAINPGNSGGPLLNKQGKVIGINTALVGGAQNVGFAIPVADLKEFMKTLDLNL